MKIVFVIDQYEEGNNGTTMTVRRFSEMLLAHGHEVRVICGKGSGKEKIYQTGERKYPFKKLIHSEGMLFAKYDKKIVYEAIHDADVVHFLLPFHLARKTKKLCDKLNIPTTAAFHCQPQNITSTIHMGHLKFINALIFSWFRTFYKKFTHIHCPSDMIKEELIRHHYKSKLVVISNGISDYFHKVDVSRPEEYKDKILVVMTGRYSVEKRQDLIIHAIANSKYESKIQLILPGQGPLLNKYKKMSSNLTNKVVFGFQNPENLRNILSYSDIYVHASDAEIEGMACTEALACGLVPVISDSKKSATNQFALSCYSLFTHGNYLDLRDKIDYLIKNEDYRRDLSQKYIDSSKQYLLENCVKKFESEFLDKALEKFNSKM